MNRTDISKILAEVPTLNDFGIGLFHDGRGLSTTEKKAKHAELQESLLRREELCTKVYNWVSTKTRIKTINTRHSSYGLKHMAERELGEYVSNGAFIAAAIHAGFPYKITPGDPNVHFGISKRSLTQ